MNTRHKYLLTFAIVIIGLCYVQAIMACGTPPPPPPPPAPAPGGPGGPGGPGPGAGEPIDLTNGSYFSFTTDLVVKGRSHNVVIKRHYTSNDTSKVRMDASDYFTQTQVEVTSVVWHAPYAAQNVAISPDGKVLECTFNASGSYQFTLDVYYTYAGGSGMQIFTYSVDYSSKAAPTFLGNGWNLSYNIFLDEISTEKILLFNGAHTSYLFTKKPYTNPVEYQPPAYTTATDFIKLVKNQNGTYTLTKKLNVVWEFNNTGQITVIKDRNNNCIMLGYTNDKLTDIADDLGRNITLSYNGTTGLLETITDASGRQIQYAYEADNDLSTVTRPGTPDYPDGLTTTYTYNDDHLLLTVADAYNNVWLSNTYTDGKVTTQQHGESGQEYSLSYDPANLKATFTDRRGYHTVYTYNNSGQTLSEIIYEGEVGTWPSYATLYEYNSDKTLHRIRLPKDNQIFYSYDNYHNISEIMRFGYDPKQLYYAWQFMDYDDKGSIQTYKEIGDAGLTTTSFTYDYEDPSYGTSVGNLMKITLPMVQNENDINATPEINFAYNDYGQVREIELPDSIVIRYDYGTSGNNTGKIIKITYDYGTGDALNLEYQLTYDSYGNIDTVTKPDNSTTIDLDYNVLHQLTQIQNELGFVTKYHYTKNGMPDKTQRQIGSSYNDSTAQTWGYDYDILNKLTKITNPLGNITEIGKDDSYNVTSIMDPEGRDALPQYSTNYTYTARNLLTKVTDAEDGQINYSWYDLNGNLAWVDDHYGKRTEYYYDFMDRLCKIVYPDGSYEQFTYEHNSVNSNITQKRKRDGTIICYAYDALYRKKSKQIGTGTITYYKYDIMGRLRYVKEDTTTVASYNYDRIGRLTSTTDSYGNTISYEYNDNSLRTKLTYPYGGYITYEYDDAERLRYIKDNSAAPVTLAAFDYDELDRITKVTYANGQYEEYDYEDAGSGDDDKGLHIKQVSYSTSSLYAFNYLRDKVGNITSKDYGSSSTFDYIYDKIYQLAFADYPGTDDDWTFNYDKVYNRTSTVSNGVTTYYTLDSITGLNQYASVGGISYSYDINGNLTNDGTNKYVFNVESYLTTLKNQSDAVIASYTHDWSGRRISKTYNSVTTTYVYDGDNLIAEYENGTLVRKFIYGPGIDFPIMMIAVDGETETAYYYFRDPLGSVVALLNNSGTIVEAYSYDPFGKPTVRTAAGTDNKWLTSDDTMASSPVSAFGNWQMFTARQWDAESGLYYYRARMYHPQLGRFLQPDPIGYYNSMNLYQYCLNNPINFIDPYGLFEWDTGDFIGSIGAGAIGGAILGPGWGVGAIGGGIAYGGAWAISNAWDWAFGDPDDDDSGGGDGCSSGGAGAGGGPGIGDGGGLGGWG